MSRITCNPKVVDISATTIFENFDSLSVVDNGSDGFQVEDHDGNTVSWPSGTALNVAGKQGQVVEKLIIKAPLTGSLDATAVVVY